MAGAEPTSPRNGSPDPAPGRGGAVVRGPPRRASGRRTTLSADWESAWRMWSASSAGVVRALRPLVEGIT